MDLPVVRVPCLRLSRGLRVVIGLFFFLAGKDAHNDLHQSDEHFVDDVFGELRVL